MSTLIVDAVYENGVLKPERPLPLREQEKVRITVEPAISWVERTYGLIRWTGDHETLERILAEAEETEYL